jgi:hypothetical protein
MILLLLLHGASLSAITISVQRVAASDEQNIVPSLY